MEPTPETKPFFSWLRNRFLTGLFTVLPVLLTYWIIRFVYNVVNGPADRYIRALVENHLLPGSDYFLAHHEGTIPGAGFAVTLLLIFLIGIVASHLVGQRFFHFLETIFLRIPVVKVIYQALRQAVQAVQQIGGDPSAGGNPFRQVAYITLPGSEAKLFGFVTGRFVDPEGTAQVILFVPNAPSPLAGFVLAVPEEKVQLAPWLTGEQMTKMVISMGLISPITAATAPVPEGQA
ncbi:MAG: DUF502 domain-containing protein [Verrucomicrobium sp.]|nr:DUF502 domain-containing protein [Verrucomicrobium sp.]